MSNVAQIRRQDQVDVDPLHAERAALDSAIQTHRKSVAAVTAATDSLRRGRDLVAAGEARVEAAKIAIDAAREADGASAAKALRQRDTPGGASTLKSARRALADAEDDVDVARSALAKIEADLLDAVAERQWAANTVIIARNELLRPLAEKILERSAQLRRDLRICEALAAEILDRDDPPDAPSFDDEIVAMKARAERVAVFGDLRKQGASFYLNHRTIGEDDAAAVGEAKAGLQAAIAALAKDPSTPLPPLP